MEWNEAQERARFFDFEINVTNGDRTWFNAMKTWDYTGQTFALEVKPETNQFRFTKMHGPILIDSTWLGSYDNDVQFLRWQKHFMETIEKLAPSEDVNKALKKKLHEKNVRLDEAESLLQDARSLMDNVHCYETEVYKEIGIFLHGEEE